MARPLGATPLRRAGPAAAGAVPGRWPLRGRESPQDRPPGRGAQCAFTASNERGHRRVISLYTLLMGTVFTLIDYCHTSTTTAAFRRLSQASPRRTTRPTDLRVSRPQSVLATSLGYSTPSEPIIPPTNSSASPKFTRWQQAAFTASQRSHIETLLQGHNRSHDHELLHQRHVPRAHASPLRRPWPETSTHQGRHGDAAVEAAR